MRVAENLNAALHGLLDDDPTAYVLGEDVLDPYGGAFKITKGLSMRFPGRVIGTPISEGALTGVAAGLALTGNTAVAEIMFGDFVALAFDQICNFASKSVSMYGKRLPLRMVVRCPTGGGRGYGPTHSQSMQKHFVGMPGLSLYEMSPFHDNRAVFTAMLQRGEPCLFFEDKVLYTRQMDQVDPMFRVRRDGELAVIDLEDRPDCVIIAPGGMAHRTLAAMKTLVLQQEISCRLLVPSRLYPLDVDAMLPHLGEVVLVAEESTAGGTWGGEVAHLLHERVWDRLRGPVRLVHSRASVIPTAAHLESEVLAGESTIHDAVRKALRG
ncbi:alpha-ketoacid dehydrogenase subunit beta [Streptosporangium carneum]|uniref:3-methyl-2-oxobutanoate dehydrogenase (2-methylpropanoyl-transferring) n=1 Tax=Streptosporangium carneum TaxID=47481 RepID=A0A9W6I106_9ACTN|nr:transketolase C-terminal domain-containing protein [Streptosporangium carneum]GLK09456.1 pyruvate dehydrogenase [Streptosporangium carneum]